LRNICKKLLATFNYNEPDICFKGNCQNRGVFAAWKPTPVKDGESRRGTCDNPAQDDS